MIDSVPIFVEVLRFIGGGDGVEIGSLNRLLSDLGPHLFEELICSLLVLEAVLLNDFLHHQFELLLFNVGDIWFILF